MQYINTAWTALSPYLHNDNAYHRLEPSEPPGCRAIRSVLARNRLNDPSLWSGYNDFIDIAPPERGQITLDKCADYFSAEVMRDRHRVPRGYPGFSDLNQPLYQRVMLHNVALHYPVDRGNNQWETICRWDLMTAWELLRQVALTRACLVEIVSQKDYPSEWTAPEPEVLASLNDWAEATADGWETMIFLSAERLDDYLVFIHHFERIGRAPTAWSLSESIPDRLADTYLMGGTGLHQLPCKLFERLNHMLDGKDILSDRLTARSAAATAGLIRALVEEFRPYQPYGTEPKVFAWWRKRLPYDQSLVKYADRSDLGLDVASRYRREVGGWAFLLGIPESDSAEKVDKSLGGEPGIPESRSAEKVDGSVRSDIPESDSAGKIDRNLSLGIPASKSAEKVEQVLVLGSTKPSIRSKDASMATQKDSLSP